MLGVVIGISAVLAMITLGQFTKRKILKSYEALGVNQLMLRGWPNWERQATDRITLDFTGFDVEHDLGAVRRIFPEIAFASPMQIVWNPVQATAGGLSVKENVRLVGVNEEYLRIANRSLVLGKPLGPFQIEGPEPRLPDRPGYRQASFETNEPDRRVISGRSADRVTFPAR